MASQIIKEYGKDDKADFFAQLHAKTQVEEEIMEADDDAITRRMKMHLLEKKGKLFYKVAQEFTGFSSFEEEVDDNDNESDEEMKVDGKEEQVIDDELFDRSFMKGHKGAITTLNW
jgi:hypothetical protein